MLSCLTHESNLLCWRNGASMTIWVVLRNAPGLCPSGRGPRGWAGVLACALAILLPAAGPSYTKTADSTLLATRSYVARWLAALPDIVCQQTTERFTLNLRQMWRRDEISQAELTVEQGVERYRLLSVNGQPPSQAQSAAAHLQASSGEFLSAVRRLFDPISQAEFQRRGSREEHGRKLCRYDFRILQANSQWYVGADPGYRPAYSGSIWVDLVDGGPARLDMKSRAFPSSIPIRMATMQTTFELAPINGEFRLLPSRSEVVVFANWGYAERRVIRYSNYRRFAAASRILPAKPE